MKTWVVFSPLVVLLTASAVAQDYAIKMNQPLEVGQRYRFTVVATDYSEIKTSTEQQAPRTQKKELSVEMESMATVLEVDAKGRPTKESHIILKLLQGAKKEPLLADGTKVIASRPGRTTEFEIGGKLATGAVAKALELAVEITSGGATDDEVFGTSERKKVGDSWPVNEALALKDAKEKFSNAFMNVAGVKGTTTLQKVTNDGGGEVIHLLADVTVTGSPAVKERFYSFNATINASFIGAFPEDLTRNVREDSATMTIELDATGKPSPQGPVVQMSSKAKRSLKRQYKLLD